MVPPVRSGMDMLDLVLTNGCRRDDDDDDDFLLLPPEAVKEEGDELPLPDVIFTDAALLGGNVMGDANLYLDPEDVVTIFFSTAMPASTSGLVTIASPSGIVG